LTVATDLRVVQNPGDPPGGRAGGDSMKVAMGVLIAAVLVAVGFVWLAWAGFLSVRPPIRVGLLHSLTGPMAISEASMVDAEKMAIEELNAQGGLLGRRIEAVVADGRSEPSAFAREAERLIDQEKVDVLIGCWTSSCRKAVKAVVERTGHLLIYPVAYEGLEQSPNIVYTGAAPNQQVVPTVTWCLNTLKAKTFFLIGSDTVWPHSVNAIIADQLTAFGATKLGEVYLPYGTSDVDAAVDQALKAKPDVVLSTIEGETNLPFYKKIRGTDAAAWAKIPVVTYPVTEEELRQLPARDMTNDYGVCNYFQSIDRPENREFVRRFKARFGADRVTADAVAAAYSSVKLWAQAVVEAETSAVSDVRPSLLRQSLNAAEGVISVDRETQHTYRPFFVGRVRPDGQFEIVLAVNKPIRPNPFPFSRSRADWTKFLDSLRASRGWGRAAPGTGGAALAGL
jgi:urea transport system substrate-binding protein